MVSIVFPTKYREITQILGLCLLWYAVSSAMGVVGKIVLSDFPYPMTVTMVQLLSIIIYLIPILKFFVRSHTTWIPYNIPLRYWFQMILPLAFGKFVSSVSSHVSIWKVPVSYVHTVKATMPIFTVILSRIILRERQTTKVYFSLIPIVCGVVIASMTELSFDVVGLISALISTVGFALQNIFSKKCLKDTDMHQFSLLLTLAIISTIFFFPLWILFDLNRILQDTSLSHSSHLPRLMALLVIDGFCNFAQNLIAFSIIAIISPLSYSVASCTKRVAIISVSLFILGNQVTALNVVGMAAAVLGVLLYNKAKYDQHQEARKAQSLPSCTAQSQTSNSTTNQMLEFANYDNQPKFVHQTNGSVHVDGYFGSRLHNNVQLVPSPRGDVDHTTFKMNPLPRWSHLPNLEDNLAGVNKPRPDLLRAPSYAQRFDV